MTHAWIFSGDSKEAFKNYTLCNMKANEQKSKYEEKLLLPPNSLGWPGHHKNMECITSVATQAPHWSSFSMFLNSNMNNNSDEN